MWTNELKRWNSGWFNWAFKIHDSRYVRLSADQKGKIQEKYKQI